MVGNHRIVQKKCDRSLNIFEFSRTHWLLRHKLVGTRIWVWYISAFQTRVLFCFGSSPHLHLNWYKASNHVLGGSIVLPGVALRAKLQYIARFQLQPVQSIWCQLWDVMNKFWWVIPTAHECFVTKQKASWSHCVHYCIDCNREKMCGFFSVCKPDLLSALRVSIYAYVWAYFSFL